MNTTTNLLNATTEAEATVGPLNTTKEQRRAFRKLWKQLHKEGAHKPTWHDQGNGWRPIRIPSKVFNGAAYAAAAIIMGRPYAGGTPRYHGEFGVALRLWPKTALLPFQAQFKDILTDEQWKQLWLELQRLAPTWP